MFSSARMARSCAFNANVLRNSVANTRATEIAKISDALYRPGPMGMISDFIDRKYGRKEIEYIHPSLEPILSETYGIIV